MEHPQPAQQAVLLVDDYPVILEIGRAFLEDENYTVVTCENGREAVEQFTNQTFDIILIDVNMPEMNGPEATRIIRAMPAGRKIPIIGMTAETSSVEIENCTNAGMNDFLIKPFNLSGISEILSKWITLDPRTPPDAEKIPDPSFDTSDHDSPPISSTTDPLNYEKALKEFENDSELLRDVIIGFIKKLGEQLPAMHRAMAEGNIGQVKDEAHAIKGGAANLCAERLSYTARVLEAACRNDETQTTADTLKKLQEEYNTFKEFVTAQLNLFND